MIEQFFRPDSVEQALELKRRYQDEAVWFAGGSKLNATPTRTDKRLPFPYRIWNWTGLTGITVHCGLVQCLACSHCVMRDLFLQHCVKPSVLFTHAMFVISRPLVVKSPPGRKSRCCFLSCWHWMLNWFLATAKRCQSRTTASPCDRLLTEIIIKDPYRTCATRKISRSQAGLTVVTAAVAMTDHDGMRIALDGVASKALRLHDVENKIWKAMHLNRLSPTPFSRRKICGAAWPINAISREFW